MNKTEEFIRKARLKHGDTYDYSNVEYFGANKKVCIICKIHGVFLQTPSSHYKSGCQKCGYISQSNKHKSNTEEFIEKSKIEHGERYEYSKVVYNGVDNKVVIICKTHGEFLQSPYGHLSGKGCKKCANKQIGEMKKSNTEEFVEKAKQIHGDLYDYSKVNYCDNTTLVTIICKTHGEYKQRPSNHLLGKKCQKCANIYSPTTEEFIEKVKIIHGDKYDYTKVNYVKCDLPIIIICKIHGEFKIMPSSHLNGCGCNLCGIITTTSKVISNTEDFIEKAKIIYGDKYDYSKVEYTKANEKVIIKCKKHGEFTQKASSHYKGYEGCSKCWKKKQHSKQQILWLEFISKLHNNKIQHAENDGEFSIPNTRYKADGYCLETNTIYEFHGDYWHGNPNKFNCDEYNKTTDCSFGELYQKTIEKEEFIKTGGFNLITCWENDWKKLNRCVTVLQKQYRNTKSN